MDKDTQIQQLLKAIALLQGLTISAISAQEAVALMQILKSLHDEIYNGTEVLSQ